MNFNQNPIGSSVGNLFIAYKSNQRITFRRSSI